MQYAAVCRAQSSRLKSFSCSEMPQDDSGLTTPQDESLTKLCDDVAARIEARMKQQSFNEQRYKVVACKIMSFYLFKSILVIPNKLLKEKRAPPVHRFLLF